MNVHSAFENCDYFEILNCYAIWITENPQYFCRGGQKIMTPTTKVKQANGMRYFLQYNAPEGDWKHWETPISNFIKDNPEEIKEKADIFAKLFPNVIKGKIKKKTKEIAIQHKAIESFIQNEIPFQEKEQKKEPRNQDSFIEVVDLLSSKGVKSIKTPDGWEIQF